jgi:hypothetical protein
MTNAFERFCGWPETDGDLMTARSMTARQPSMTIRRRLGWLVLLVAALLARSTAPEGWMPVANAAGGIEIALCNGMGPDTVMVLGADGALHKKAPASGHNETHPCAFAGMGVGDAPPVFAVASLAPTSAESAAPINALVGFPGRGLAAPPPPAIGPPAFA